MDKAKEAKLHEQHGDLVIAKIAGKEFAFKRPEDTDYEEFQQGIAKVGSNDKVKIGPLFREYCMKSLVDPPLPSGADVLEQAFRVQPATAARIADKLSDLAGADAEVTVKKG